MFNSEFSIPIRWDLHPSHRWQAFFLPITDATKLHGFVARFRKRFGNARRASSTASIEDDVRVLWKLAHSFFNLCHRNVDRAGNRAAFFDLRCLSDVHHDGLLGSFKFLFQFGNGDAFSSHTN